MEIEPFLHSESEAPVLHSFLERVMSGASVSLFIEKVRSEAPVLNSFIKKVKSGAPVLHYFFEKVKSGDPVLHSSI